MLKNKTVSIVVLVYVGLPAALIVANAGYKTTVMINKDTDMITSD